MKFSVKLHQIGKRCFYKIGNNILKMIYND